MPRRAIQRERKRKTTTKSTTNNASEEANQMVNTQIVKVIVQQPKKKVVNRKPKTEKRDSKKKLAIEKLKQTLELFRNVKERALQAKVTIPASIGEMPPNLENTKKVEDIETLTNTLMTRIREIEQLISKKNAVPKYFGMPEHQGAFPSGYAHEFRGVVNTSSPFMPLVNPTTTPTQPVKPIIDPSIEAKLKAIESGLDGSNPEDSLEAQKIQKERQQNIQNITQAFNTKKQAIGIQLSGGKITQEQYDKQIAAATKEYNDQLAQNDAEANEKLKDLVSKTIGLDTKQEWKNITDLAKPIRNKIRGSNSLNSPINELEIVELETLHTDLKRLFLEFQQKHRNAIEQHRDLLKGFDNIKTLVSSTIRSLIKVPISDTESLSDKVKDANKRLEEVNQMYIQLKEDVNRGIGNNDANIRKKIEQIEKYHEEVKAINLKEGVPPTHIGLKPIEDAMARDKEQLLQRNRPAPVLSEEVKKAIRRLEEVNQMYLQLKEDVDRGITTDIRAKIDNIEKYHEEVKDLNSQSGVQPTDPGLRTIEATLAIEKRELLARQINPAPLPQPQPSIPDNIRKAQGRLEEINQMYLQLKEDVDRGIGDTYQNIRIKVDDIEDQHNQVKATNLQSGVQPTNPSLRGIEVTLANEKRELLARHSRPTVDLDASRGKLTSYLKQDPGWVKWRPELARALQDLGWNGYVYTDPKTNQSTAFLNTSKGLKRQLLNSLIGNLDIPPNWSK